MRKPAGSVEPDEQGGIHVTALDHRHRGVDTDKAAEIDWDTLGAALGPGTMDSGGE